MNLWGGREAEQEKPGVGPWVSGGGGDLQPRMSQKARGPFWLVGPDTALFNFQRPRVSAVTPTSVLGWQDMHVTQGLLWCRCRP